MLLISKLFSLFSTPTFISTKNNVSKFSKLFVEEDLKFFFKRFKKC